MSFGLATWLASLLIAAGVGGAVWAFRLTVRPPRVAVPSVAIWRRVLDDRRARTLWDRIRRAVSLALTIAVALLLTMAAARPMFRKGPSSGRLTIVLDSSWSMGARTSDGGTRWTRAVSEARILAASSDAEDVTIATTGQGIVEGPTNDAARLSVAFDRLRVGGGAGQIAWPANTTGTTHFITDGAVARSIPAGVVVHSVFEPAANVAVTAFAARPAVPPGVAAVVFLEITNAATAQRVHVTVTREATVIHDRQIEMAAGEIVREALPLEGEGARLRARVSAPSNALQVDDEAVAWLEAGEPIRVAVATEHPEAFRRLLDNDPAIRPTYLRPADYRAIPTDAWIFDAWLPPAAPLQPALVLEPPAKSWLAVRAREEVAPVWAGTAPHPVLDGVDPLTVDVRRARAPETSSLRAIATSTKGTPLVSIGEGNDVRMVVVNFGVDSSNLIATPAFPVLVGNALDWLAHPVPLVVVAGGTVALPKGTSNVLAPDGQAVPLIRETDLVFARLDQPGLYRVTAGRAHGVLAVNAGDAVIADLSRTTLPRESAQPASAFIVRPIWIYGAWLALGLLALEWWTWHRRVTV